MRNIQIRRSNKDNLGIIINFSSEKYILSHRDSSNEGSQHIFSLRNTKNYLQYSLLSGALGMITLCDIRSL